MAGNRRTGNERQTSRRRSPPWQWRRPQCTRFVPGSQYVLFGGAGAGPFPTSGKRVAPFEIV